MTSYTETRQAYARNRTMEHLSTSELEKMERLYCDQVTWVRWRGTQEETNCARVQAELEIRTRSAKRQAA